MKWKRPEAATLLILVFAAAAVFLGWRLVNPSEPAYLGKPLGAWVRQYDTNYLGGDASKSSADEAQRAIQHIGDEVRYQVTNALSDIDPEAAAKAHMKRPGQAP